MLAHTPLGQKSDYIQTYTPALLCPIPRSITLQKIFGYDLWHAYELSWLNPEGKPGVAMAAFIFPSTSPYLIESKSFKLYLNSLNQTPLASPLAVQKLLETDLSAACGASVRVMLTSLDDPQSNVLQQLSGICLDLQAISCDTYHVSPDYLQCSLECSASEVKESLYSHLLKSNCPITTQPDWGSLVIDYAGKQINHAGLLRYIVSFRNHQDFHEQCVERIFTDIWQRCAPNSLKVAAYYTRRGGLDINPVRASYEISVDAIRLGRQ